jgi:cell wall-associated NlpC family hydrolase
LVQVVYKVFGYNLPRDAHQQALQGKPVSFQDVQPGDLAFFENHEGKVTHTGIILVPNKIIHAHGWVRADKLDEKGIYNAQRGIYTHSFNSIRRIIPDQSME